VDSEERRKTKREVTRPQTREDHPEEDLVDPDVEERNNGTL